MSGLAVTQPSLLSLTPKYDAMCVAVRESFDIDEIMGIRDLSLALEVAARMANNVEWEVKAVQIRLRAERRTGELLAMMEKRDGGDARRESLPRSVRGSEPPPPRIADLGLTYQQSSDFQRMASIPPDLFEEALQQPRPSTASIVRLVTPAKPPQEPPVKQGDTRALKLWGDLSTWANPNGGMLHEDPAEIFGLMNNIMKGDAKVIAPKIIEWLQRMLREG